MERDDVEEFWAVADHGHAGGRVEQERLQRANGLAARFKGEGGATPQIRECPNSKIPSQNTKQKQRASCPLHGLAARSTPCAFHEPAKTPQGLGVRRPAERDAAFG